MKSTTLTIVILVVLAALYVAAPLIAIKASGLSGQVQNGTVILQADSNNPQQTADASYLQGMR